MRPRNNKSVFSTVEFELWVNKERLIPAEDYLIDNYLDKQGKTLEGGTGGGRILHALKQRGFSSLYGFDFVPEFIENARLRDSSGSIRFEVQDAAALEYKDSSFDQLIYLQQVLSFVEDESSRTESFREAYRVLGIGGTALFSFLCFEARRNSAVYLPYLAYLRLLRSFRRSHRPLQYLPWLKLGGKFSFASLVDSRPHVYWFRLEEVCKLLSEVGFRIEAIGSARQVRIGNMASSLQGLPSRSVEGMLYVVARK